MADDELLVNIDKAFWPRGVVRGLTPVLRALGDKHGNMVIAAQPTKGHIMLKGTPEQIEAAKSELNEIICEHFPDAPVPDELSAGDGKAEWHNEAEGGQAEEEAPAPRAPAAPAVAVPTTGTAKPKASAPSAAAVPTGPPQPPVAGRKRLRLTAMASPDLLWECTRKSSSFIRRPMRSEIKKPFSAEPHNLVGFHALKYSGVAASEALDVRGVKDGDKESIQISQSSAKASRLRRPKSAVVKLGLSKCPKRGLIRLDREVDAKFYRRDLRSVAMQKYTKVQQSFKKKKRTVKSRRARA